jgi:hypothetical protein
MKVIFDGKAKQRDFIPDGLLLKWDSMRKEPRKDGNLIIYG